MKWISVKEKLPDTDRFVLITDGATTFEGWYNSDTNTWFVLIPSKGYVSSIDISIVWFGREESITHWSDDYSLPDNNPKE